MFLEPLFKLPTRPAPHHHHHHHPPPTTHQLPILDRPSLDGKKTGGGDGPIVAVVNGGKAATPEYKRLQEVCNDAMPAQSQV